MKTKLCVHRESIRNYISCLTSDIIFISILLVSSQCRSLGSSRLVVSTTQKPHLCHFCIYPFSSIFLSAVARQLDMLHTHIHTRNIANSIVENMTHFVLENGGSCGDIAHEIENVIAWHSI